jgi:hypothetical protein
MSYTTSNSTAPGKPSWGSNWGSYRKFKNTGAIGSGSGKANQAAVTQIYSKPEDKPQLKSGNSSATSALKKSIKLNHGLPRKLA